MPYDKQAFASYLRRKQERRRAAEDMTRRMIERSVKQIAHSKELLSKEVPKVWHPEGPEHQVSHVCSKTS